MAALQDASENLKISKYLFLRRYRRTDIHTYIDRTECNVLFRIGHKFVFRMLELPYKPTYILTFKFLKEQLFNKIMFWIPITCPVSSEN